MAPLQRIVLGTMEVGRRMNLSQTKEFIKTFLSYGHHELDTAYMYSGGADGGPTGGLTEEILGKVSTLNKSTISTKANPGGGRTLSSTSLRYQLETSLRKLDTDHVDIFYLHWPCMDVPLEETLGCANKLYNEGKFKRLGVSNYISWQIAEIQSICSKEGYVAPTVYQGMYNCLTRMVETELLPCLRRYNMSFLAYNPLAGGILTNKHKQTDTPDTQADSGRFFGTDVLEKAYRARYWRGRYFDAINIISAACTAEEIEMYEAALRWLQYHSKLCGDRDDGVIIGSSNTPNLHKNLGALADKGPLPDAVVNAIESAHQLTAGHGPPYFRSVAGT